MTETIIKISEAFPYDFVLYGYDDEDASTLGAKEVLETIVIKNNTVESTCRLMGNDAIKHIQSPVIIAVTGYESGYSYYESFTGSKTTKYREADIEEIELAISILKAQPFKFNGGSAQYVDKIENYLTQVKRETTLDKLI